MKTEAWTGKRVLLTGGAGFLGSFVAEQLNQMPDVEVFIPRSKDFDLRKQEAQERVLQMFQPHIVIHLAANVGGIGANSAKPAEFFYDNLMMGVPLLHSSWKAGVEKFVAVGTVCSYPKFTPSPFQEEALWNGYPEETNAPYGLAKKMLLVAAQSYREQYGFNSIFLLPTNLYGPRDNFDPESSHVIPALIRKCVEARESGRSEISVWGSGNPTREFLYAEDAAEGILLAAQSYDGREPVNLGCGEEISIRELVEIIARCTGFEGAIVWDRTRPDGQPRRRLNTMRAKEYFGFEASTNFEEGLKRTVEWYLDNRLGSTSWRANYQNS